MVGFSLTFCSPDQIEPLLLTRNFIEMKVKSLGLHLNTLEIEE